MHADYSRGVVFSKIGRRFPQRDGRPRNGQCIRNLFRRHRFPLRPMEDKYRRRHSERTGCFLASERHSPAEVARLVKRQKVIAVPAELRREWRHWPMARRRDFIVRLRARLKPAGGRPAWKFSANVTPFDYWTPAAWEVLRRENSGRRSRLWRQRLFPKSQGVIYGGSLWFWNKKYGGTFGAYYRGTWRRTDKRPALHRVIWEAAHGRSLAEDEMVIHADGNKNNLAPGNLQLLTRAANGIRNRDAGRARKGEAKARILLERFNLGGSTAARLLVQSPKSKVQRPDG
jgi:hypothetical protein